jgi:hypothetical protein
MVAGAVRDRHGCPCLGFRSGISSTVRSGNVEHDNKPADDPGCAQGCGLPVYRIAIEAMENDGDSLRIVIRTGKIQTAVEFDIKTLLKKTDPD